MTHRRRCAIYTRKSTEEGLEQGFNSLHAQREACEAFIRSQRHEGWQVLPEAFDDGGYSGATMERPALARLLAAAKSGKVDVIVVYKVDRLTRSLVDFARMVELFDANGVSFVSVTQQFNTTTSMGLPQGQVQRIGGGAADRQSATPDADRAGDDGSRRRPARLGREPR